MRSFVFNGTDFGCLIRAKVVEERALGVVPKTAAVSGRAGEAILDAAVPPKAVKLKLFLEPIGKMDAAQMVEVRRRLYAALLATQDLCSHPWLKTSTSMRVQVILSWQSP